MCVLGGERGGGGTDGCCLSSAQADEVNHAHVWSQRPARNPNLHLSGVITTIACVCGVELHEKVLVSLAGLADEWLIEWKTECDPNGANTPPPIGYCLFPLSCLVYVGSYAVVGMDWSTAAGCLPPLRFSSGCCGCWRAAGMTWHGQVGA